MMRNIIETHQFRGLIQPNDLSVALSNTIFSFNLHNKLLNIRNDLVQAAYILSNQDVDRVEKFLKYPESNILKIVKPI